ncbi:MAG: hypothetical protein VXX85_05840 [Candidatus Margulisiibacteriota bacterium]|nr:hypothetical protein [Candidatus Margulisiibacteriota bacterium]
MIVLILIIGIALFLLERIISDHKLPHVNGWWCSKINPLGPSVCFILVMR